MFNVTRVSRQIREARIRKNMTQSNLADELGVSYQAVSNWERGNSLPDISKYGDLCRILELTLDELLGGDSGAKAVSKFMDYRKGESADPLTAEEISSVADLLAPEELKKTVNEHLDKVTFDIKDAKRLAPFLDKDTLNELAENVSMEDPLAAVGLAPFLSKRAIKRLIERVEDSDLKFELLVKAAPFLNDETIEVILKNMSIMDIKELDGCRLKKLAPFLSKDALDRLAEDINIDDPQGIVSLAPFLRQKTIKRLVERIEDKDLQFKTLVKAAPFLRSEMLEEILENIDVTDIDRIEKVAPFLSSGTLKRWIQRGMRNGRRDE